MSKLVGLTGSIGMGKSTTAGMFAQEGVPVWDADAAVHRIYQPGGIAVEPIQKEFPEVIENNGVSREKLKELIAQDPNALRRIEKIVHPLVAQDRQAFIAQHSQAEIVLFDIPLLFETEADQWLDVTICVTAPADIQKERVLSRPGMTAAQFETILARQMPDAEKRTRADYVIETLTLKGARTQVRDLIAELRGSHA